MGDDDLRASSNRGRGDVAILGIIGHPIEDAEMAGDHCRGKCVPHDGDPMLGTSFAGQVVVDQVSSYFIEDIFAPSELIEARRRRRSNVSQSAKGIKTHASKTAFTEDTSPRSVMERSTG